LCVERKTIRAGISWLLSGKKKERKEKKIDVKKTQ
jgi:hypothetical protein